MFNSVYYLRFFGFCCGLLGTILVHNVVGNLSIFEARMIRFVLSIKIFALFCTQFNLFIRKLHAKEKL